MVKYTFMDEIAAKDEARIFHIHVRKDYDLFNFFIFNWGRPFVNHFWEKLITKFKISINLSTIHHPRIDGETEIMNSGFEQ